MIEPDVNIICHTKINPIDRSSFVVYEWQGPVKGIAGISDELFRDGLTLAALPWPVEILDKDVSRRIIYVHRLDTAYYPINRLAAQLEKNRLFWQEIKSKIIFTFVVWGLAWVSPGMIPKWGDIGKKSPYG